MYSKIILYKRTDFDLMYLQASGKIKIRDEINAAISDYVHGEFQVKAINNLPVLSIDEIPNKMGITLYFKDPAVVELLKTVEPRQIGGFVKSLVRQRLQYDTGVVFLTNRAQLKQIARINKVEEVKEPVKAVEKPIKQEIPQPVIIETIEKIEPVMQNIEPVNNTNTSSDAAINIFDQLADNW